MRFVLLSLFLVTGAVTTTSPPPPPPPAAPVKVVPVALKKYTVCCYPALCSLVVEGPSGDPLDPNSYSYDCNPPNACGPGDGCEPRSVTIANHAHIYCGCTDDENIKPCRGFFDLDEPGGPQYTCFPAAGTGECNEANGCPNRFCSLRVSGAERMCCCWPNP